MKNLKTNFLKHSFYKLILLVLLFSASAKAQIQKVEPPFWYAGMKNPELQILFYGKNIAQYEASVSNNVVIKNVEKTENPNYLFVTIDTQNLKASELLFSFKNKNKVAFTQKYSLKERRANSADRKSYDASDLIYLIMPDRFANGNSKNDSNASLNEKGNRALPADVTVEISRESSRTWIIFLLLEQPLFGVRLYAKTTTRSIPTILTHNLMFTK